MSYYRPYIIAVIMVGFLFLAALTDSKRKIKGWHYIAYLILIISGFLIGRDQTISDIKLYDMVYSGNEITVMDESKTYTFTFQAEKTIDDAYRHAGERPVKASRDDIEFVAELAFLNRKKNSKVTLALCRINNVDKYPEDAIYNYQGTNYCLLSEKILYRNAFLYLGDDYVRQLLNCIF